MEACADRQEIPVEDLTFAGSEVKAWALMIKNPVRLARLLALIEGVSFLILLGIAMPLKYAAGMPMAVKVVGWAHGLLFVAFCFALLHVMMVTNWTFKRGAFVFFMSLVPFGPFFIDRRMKQWEVEAGGTGEAQSNRISE